MATSRTPRRRPEAPSAPPTTITELARRYHSCAVALATSLGLPLTEAFLRDHRESVSSIFIAADRAGVRLPAGVQLPPLAEAPVASVNGHGATGDTPTPAVIPGEPVADGATGVAPTNGHPPPLTVADLPTHIPAGMQLPCAEALIVDLTPPQLHMLCGKVGLKALADPSLARLHLALLQERARRFANGQKPTPAGEGAA
jgi:hypothetical protein